MGIVVLLIGVAVFGEVMKWKKNYEAAREEAVQFSAILLEEKDLLRHAIIVVNPEDVRQYSNVFPTAIVTTPSKIRKMNISAVLNS